MKSFLSTSWVAFAVIGTFIGCHSHPMEMTDHPRSFPGVRTEDVNFFSSALNRNVEYRVYVPQNTPPSVRLSAVYLLHGCGTSFRDWSNYSDVGTYASKGLILVMVDGACSYYMNEALSPADKYEDYFIHDLITDAESRFPVRPRRENRAIVGVSMGGFAAVRLALTHPELFAFAGAISPAIDVPARSFSLRRWSQSVRFRTIFGPTGSEIRIQSDPFVLVKSAEPDRTPYLYVTAGEQEPLLPPIVRFTTLLKARKFAYEFHTAPGGHDWTEWDRQIPGCFASLLTQLSRSSSH
jgi:S-formylglutathione hydrolase FrmB